MYLGNENIRLVTINEDGSAEILFKDQTYMNIPKERVDNKREEGVRSMKWGLYYKGNLMGEYDNYVDALKDMFTTFAEEGMTHELKEIK